MTFRRPLAALLLLGFSALSAQEERPSCGPWRFAGLELSGLKRAKPEVVSREWTVARGEAFGCDELERFRMALEGLDLFASAEVSADGSGTVSVVVEELPPYLPIPSAKISDQDGWLVGPALIALDLFGRDVRLEAHYRTTVHPEFLRSQEFLLFESSPWIGPWKIEHELQMIRVDSWNPLKKYDERSWELDAVFARELLPGWSLLLWGEGFQVEANDSALFGKEGGHDRHGILGAGFLAKRMDRELDPRNGWRLEGRWGWAGEPFGNVGSWQELTGDLRLWRRPFRKGPVLHALALARWRPGDVPFHQLYHQGGANSLRGYGADPDRRSRDELLSTFELRQPILERRPFTALGCSFFVALEGVAGVDAARRGFDADAPGLIGFYGGLHLLLPGLDRVRFEGAWSRPEGFSFTIGLYEKTIAQRWRSR